MIRPATPDDAAAVAAIYAPIVTDTVISFELEPPGEAELRRRIEATLERLPWLVLERGGAVAGYAYAAPFKARAAYARTCEVSVYVAEPARGRGVARALYSALFADLAARGFHRAIATITLPNPASVALHEGFGFEPVGVLREAGFKFGAWRDVGLWQRGIG